MPASRNPTQRRGSPSAKRAWIEISTAELPSLYDLVALCEEGVDRNTFEIPYVKSLIVALCEEGVDRNLLQAEQLLVRGTVALCEEGVDRNWQMSMICRSTFVALCEEGVDRNILHEAADMSRPRRPLRRGRG